LFLPTQFPNSEQIGVHFRADGAGCFNSNSAKACMPLWESWTDGKVREKSFRISVNGDGKTSLDACFGKLTSNLHQAVDNGCDDITDAKSCVAAFEAGPGIGGATAATFLPTRESLLETEEKRLKQYYMLELNDDNKSIQCFHQSGFGSGCKISIESINKQWGLEMPVMPTYVATTQTQTSESDGNATHKIESKQSRDKKTSLKQAEVQQQKMVAERKKLCDDALKMGVIKCNHHEPGMGYCIASYLSEKALDKHATSGKHMYASQNFVDKAVLLASDPGGLLAAGSRCNRSDEYGIVDVVDGVGEGVTEGTEWYSIGCYRKPGRAAPQRKSEALKKELDRMFLAGEKNTGSKKNAQKYTAREARAELSSMLDTNGRLLFSNTSLLGPLPSEDQIKQYWSTFKRNQSKKGAILLEAQLEDQTEV
jgi:hypothetical protein